MSREHLFWRKVEFSDDCWLWTAGVNEAGYGRFHTGGTPKVMYAHRYSYQLANGPIPEGMEINHVCRTRACVNPAHLQLIGVIEHRRLDARRADHCPQGHVYDEANTYVEVTKTSRKKKCRACARDRARARRAQKESV